MKLLHEQPTHFDNQDNEQIRLTERGQKLRNKLLGGLAVAAALFALHIGVESQTPDSHGEQVVRVVPGDTEYDLINTHVDGGASHTGEVSEEMHSDPDNAEVFENGQLDPGEDLHLPKSVE